MNLAADTVTTFAGRPRYEGSNIRTWIGFKHFMYLTEEAVLQWFRDRGAGPQRLYHECGLGLEILDASIQLPAVLEVDDEIVADVTLLGPGTFSVKLRTHRQGHDATVLRGKVVVALICERDAPGHAPVPAELKGFVLPDARAGAPVGIARDRALPPGRDAAAVLAEDAAFVWSWTARYFLCHYSNRVQHSAYVRSLEEVVDRFLADRGISVGRMLAERGWIPVVSRARVTLLADAAMEEVIHTAFTVDHVLKGVGYEATMDCFVHRGAELVHVATARILHGYAVSRGEGAGRLAEFDDSTIAALTGRQR